MLFTDTWRHKTQIEYKNILKRRNIQRRKGEIYNIPRIFWSLILDLKMFDILIDFSRCYYPLNLLLELHLLLEGYMVRKVWNLNDEFVVSFFASSKVEINRQGFLRENVEILLVENSFFLGYLGVLVAVRYDWLNPFQPSGAFHIETSHLICTWNGWFLCEMQYLAEMG